MKRFDVLNYVSTRISRARPSAGGEWTGVCPRCEGWSCFYVNTETGAFVCFKGSCEFRGKSIVGLVSEIEGISHSDARAYVFRRAVKFQRRETMVTLKERLAALRGKEVDGPKHADAPLPREFVPCYKDGRWSLPGYLKERRIKSATARAWGLGHFSRAHIVTPLKEYDIRNRLVIPIECPAGSSWTGRDMMGNQIPKYFNPPGADHRRLLIGWNVMRFGGDIALVEGPTDTIRFYQHDITSLGLGGKELHDEQLAMLITLPPETVVVLMFDPEEKQAPLKAALKLSCHFNQIYIGSLPEGMDPGDSSRRKAHEAMENARKWTGSRLDKLREVLKVSRSSRE